MSLRKLLTAQALGSGRYYHYSNSGRALMGNPNVQESPKHYY